MNNLPIQIRQQYEQFQSLMESKTIFGAMVKFRDLTEVMLRLPVLCAGAFILEKGGSERELLTIELVKHDKIDGVGWFKIAKLIGSNKNIPKPLQNAISHVYGFIKSESIFEWRNAEVAHGALKFNPDKAFMRDFDRKIKALKKILKKLDKDFKDITVSPDGSSVTFENATLSVVPYIHSDDGEAYLFNSFGQGLAKGLCYALGTKRPMPSEQYIQAYKTQGSHRLTTGVTDNVIAVELNALIDELNEAANFEHPTYLRDWLVECMNANGSGIKKGTLMLEMERGMGKSAFSRALDGKSTDSEYKSFKIGDTFTRGYYCSRISIKSKGDFIYGISNSLLTDAQGKPLYSSDEKIPSLSENSSPEDFAELLNWSYRNIGESRLLLIIDGIDEIPSEHVSILKMLPSAEMLHDGIYILLTCRSKVELPKGKKEEDYTPEEKISFNENKHIDIVKSLVAPDRHRAYLRDDENNFEVLKAYFNHKIFPKGKSQSNDILKKLIEQPGNQRFLEVRIIGALLKSAKIKDINKFLKQPYLFHYYMDYIRTEEYGDAVFSRLTDVMVALACAQEELTFDELAYILGEDDITIQLLTFIRDMSGILRISRDYRGNHIGLASDSYRIFIENSCADKIKLHVKSLVTMLAELDFNMAINLDKKGKEHISDGVLYIASTVKSYIDKFGDDELINKLHESTALKKIMGFANAVDTMHEYRLIRAISCYNNVELLLENDNDKFAVAQIYAIRSARYKMLNRIQEAFADINHAIEIFNKCQYENTKLHDEILSASYHDRAVLNDTLLNFDLALEDLNHAIDLIKNTDKHETIASLHVTYGNVFSSMKEYQKALEYYNTAIKILEMLLENETLKDYNILTSAYVNRANIYDELAEYRNAIRDYDFVIFIREELFQNGWLSDESLIAAAYSNRGLSYMRFGDTEAALSDYNRSIQINERLVQAGMLHNINNIASTKLSRGNLFAMKHEYVKALADFDDVLKIREKLLENGKLYDLGELINIHGARSNIYRYIEQPEQALTEINMAVAYYKKIQSKGVFINQNDLASMFSNRAIVLREIGKLNEAIVDHNIAISIMESIQCYNNPQWKVDLAKAYLYRANTYVELGDFDDALSDYNTSINMMEQLYESSILNNTTEIIQAYIQREALLVQMNISSGDIDELASLIEKFLFESL